VEAPVNIERPGRDIGFVALIASVLAVPWLVTRFPIGQDLPAHVETAWQLAALWHGDDGVTSTYLAHAPPWPNSLPTVVLGLLQGLTGGAVDGLRAASVMTGLGIVAWPVSLALLLRALGRPPLLALLALPTSYDLSVAFGFLHFVVGKPLWALALATVAHAARTAQRRAVIAVVVVQVLLFHTHLLLWLSSLPLGGLVVLLGGTGLRARLVAVAGVVVGALPGLWWLLQRPRLTSSEPLPVRTFDVAWSLLWDHLGELAPGDGDVVGWVVAGVVAVVVVVASRVGRAPPRQWRDDRRAVLVLAVVGLATLGFALWGPIRTPEASIVAERFTAPGVALLVLLLPVVDDRLWPRLALLLGGVGIALSLMLPTLWRFADFEREAMGDFDALVDAVPVGAKVATVFERPLTRHGHHNVLWHWPKLVARRHAVTDDSFAWRDTCVVGLAPGARPLRPPRRPGAPITATSLRGFDHLLVQGHDRQVEAALRRGDLVVVHATGVWRLLRVVER
jgi:hypothetical protein